MPDDLWWFTDEGLPWLAAWALAWIALTVACCWSVWMEKPPESPLSPSGEEKAPPPDPAPRTP